MNTNSGRKGPTGRNPTEFMEQEEGKGRIKQGLVGLACYYPKSYTNEARN